MIRKDILFNVNTFGQNAELCSGIVTNVIGYNNSSGYPCIYKRGGYHPYSEETSVVLPLGLLENPRPMMLHNVRIPSIIHKSDKTIVDSKVKLIKQFDFNKFREIPEYVNKHKALVLYFMVHSAHGTAIPTGRSAIRFINQLNRLVDNYRYHSMSYLYYSKDKVTYPKGDLRYLLYFIDMPYCIPVLNRYKVSGMNVIFQIVSLSDVVGNRRITPIFNMVLILSNYRENIFVVDGIDIRSQKPINNEALTIAANTISKSIRNKNTFFIKEKKERVKKGEEGYAVVDTHKWEDIKLDTSHTYELYSNATYYNGTAHSTTATYTSSS